MLEVFHAFDFEIGVFAEVELAVEKHHGAVRARGDERFGELQTPNPRGARIEYVKAGRAGEAEFRLKNVSHRGLKPATPDARIDEEIDIGRR